MKTIIKILVLATMFTFGSCRTTIPDSDTTAPIFSLKITGDGFDQTFRESTSFDSFVLYLKSDTEYDFIFTANDRGGIRTASMSYPNDYIDITSPLPSTWTETSSSPVRNNLVFTGNRSDPYRIAQYAGTFRTDGDNAGSNIQIDISDFGGSSGLAGNSTSATLNIFVAPGTTTRVVPR